MTSEFELIRLIRERAQRAGVAAGPRLALGSGDDAAVTTPAGATATSTDALVDGVHFRLAQTSPHAIGHKALAAALSDLAAMGAEPGEAYVQLGLPPACPDAAALELADGLIELAATSGCALAGGDITTAGELFVAVTVVGYAERAEALITRGGGAPDDVLVLTGELGGAAAGLLLLERPELAAGVPAPVADALRRRQRRPEPRLAAGRLLAAAGARAMIDVSDGLGADLSHLARASGCGAEVELGLVPVQAGVRELSAAAGIDLVELIQGGEDYELLAAVPAPSIPAIGEAIEALHGAGARLTEVGRLTKGDEVRLLDPNGRAQPVRGHDQRRR